MIPSSHQLSLKLIERCPSCHASIPHANIHILDETEMKLLAHLACAHCLSKYLTFIVNHPQGLVGNAILTDLNYRETLHLMNHDAFDEDEFLQLFKLVSRKDFLNNITIELKS